MKKTLEGAGEQTELVLGWGQVQSAAQRKAVEAACFLLREGSLWPSGCSWRDGGMHHQEQASSSE